MNKMMRVSAVALAAAMMLAVPAMPVAAADDAPAAVSAQATTPEMRSFIAGLHPQTGDVRIPQAKAVMHLGDRYYFLPADEAKRVLVDVWRNPPESVSDVLGLVFEKGATPYDNVWGAVITYESTGHVSDADAAEQDYSAVLTQMQESQQAGNARRRAAGYPAITLIGWAQPPSYDQASHSLIWARETSAEGEPGHGLNYDIRLLGRTGVLSLNMLASMADIAKVREAASNFGKSVTFEPGATYGDFNSSTDTSAEYGLAGLVAAGAGLAVAKKLGFLAIILKFGKVILIGIAAAGAAVVAFFRRMFGAREEDI